LKENTDISVRIENTSIYPSNITLITDECQTQNCLVFDSKHAGSDNNGDKSDLLLLCMVLIKTAAELLSYWDYFASSNLFKRLNANN